LGKGLTPRGTSLVIKKMSGDIYKYLSFDQIASFKMAAGKARISAISL